MAYVIITLIVVFGGSLLGTAIWAIRILLRMERRQRALAAGMRALSEADGDGDEPDPPLRRKRHLALYGGGIASGVALLAWTRRHWMPVAAGAAGVLAASVVTLALGLGRTPAPGGPPRAGGSPSTGLTAATSLPASPSAGSVPPGTPAPTGATATVVRTGGASPSIPVIVLPGTPALSGSAVSPSSSATPTAPGTPAPSTTPGPSASATGSSCAIVVQVPPVLEVCVL